GKEPARLWIARRADIPTLEDADLLNPPLDRSFKKPGGYVMRDKLSAARERGGPRKPPTRAQGPQRTGGRPQGGPECPAPRASPRRRWTPRSAARWPSSSSPWPTTSSSVASRI